MQYISGISVLGMTYKATRGLCSKNSP